MVGNDIVILYQINKNQNISQSDEQKIRVLVPSY